MNELQIAFVCREVLRVSQSVFCIEQFTYVEWFMFRDVALWIECVYVHVHELRTYVFLSNVGNSVLT